MSNVRSIVLIGGIFTLISFAQSIHTIDNPHFFKAPRFHGYRTSSEWDRENRYETEDWRTSLDLSYAHGSARKGWDAHGNKTCLLNIHGFMNALYLMTNVPAEPCSTNFVHAIARDINQSKGCGSFGQLSFNGKFSLDEVTIDIRQNLLANFFIALHLPIRHIEVKDVCFEDCSAECGKYSQCNPYWRRFKNNLNPILANHCLEPYCKKFSQTATGDLSILGGWHTIDTQAFDLLHYIGATVQAGILFPTGSKEDTSYPFAIPSGYNDHWAIPLHADAMFGLTRWLRLSVRTGALFFFDKTRPMRIKTDTKQCGWIKLGHGCIKEDKGTYWYVGGDLLFDHAFKGLSFLVGYSYNRGEKDSLKSNDSCCIVSFEPCGDPSACLPCPPGGSCATSTAECCNSGNFVSKCTRSFDEEVINSDCRLEPWLMHTLHFLVEYDFSVHMPHQQWAPHLKFFYDFPISGKHAFDTDMVGGGISIDIRW